MTIAFFGFLLSLCNSSCYGDLNAIGSSNSIFTIAAGNLCLDLYGQNTTNGNKVDVWECVGSPQHATLKGQQWIFNAGSYQIQSNVDPRKCVDAGDMEEGFGLKIWDCNGTPQQKWGFSHRPTANLGKIYLTTSGSDVVGYMGSAGGDGKAGNQVTFTKKDYWHSETWYLTALPSVEGFDVAV